MEWIPDYIAGKHGKKKVKYVHESLKPILEKTFGIALYQEQILKIAQVFGGFSLGEADLLRRAIGKKIPEELAAQRQKFIDGAVKKGNSEKLAITIFEKVIEPFAGYGFNRSHAACYALIAYRTAYLKANYPTEFMAALLSCDAGNTDRVIRDIEECENMNVAILPPSINESLKNFTVAKPGEIRFGLSAIKGIGDSVVAEIINARELEGEFKTFGDLIARLPAKVVNKKSLEALAKSGALSQFEDPKTIIENTEVISKFARSSASQNKQTNQESLFDSEIIEVKPELALENKFKSKTIHRLNWEKEVLGLFVSDHPLKNMENYFAHQGVLIAKLHSRIPPRNPVTIGGILANFRKITTKTKAQMATFTLEDPSGKIDVVAFPKTYGQYAEVFSENGIFIIKGKWDRRNGSLQVVADSIEVVEFDLAKSKSQELPPLKIKASLAEQTKESSLTVDPGIISKSNYSSSQVKTQDQIKKDSIYRIKIPKGTDRKALMQINEACQNCPGSDTLQLEVEGKRFTLPKKVNYSRFLKREVGSILGVESLAVA
jgi:DNA polymerase-3 subunit alpha